MESKTYFASSVPAALELARKELGPDAMLVGSRPAPRESRSFGRLEVTFAYERSIRVAANQASERVSVQPARGGSGEWSELREELAALRNAIGNSGSNFPVRGIGFDSSERMTRRLVQAGLDEETARQVATAASGSTEAPDAAVRSELVRRVQTTSFAECKPGETRTLAFIGPSGRGKTTSLVKVAIRFGLSAGIPTRIYCAGVHPVGAAEQAARYANILGVPFSWHETPEALHLALQGERWRGLVLIDTPAIGPFEEPEFAAWDRVFRANGEVERHLVLRADARSADISIAVDRYRCLNPTHLFFTGLDEVANEACLVETAITSGLPLCLAGNGPRIPDDLAMVTSASVVRSFWAEQSMTAAA